MAGIDESVKLIINTYKSIKGGKPTTLTIDISPDNHVVATIRPASRERNPEDFSGIELFNIYAEQSLAVKNNAKYAEMMVPSEIRNIVGVDNKNYVWIFDLNNDENNNSREAILIPKESCNLLVSRGSKSLEKLLEGKVSVEKRLHADGKIKFPNFGYDAADMKGKKVIFSAKNTFYFTVSYDANKK